MTKARLPKKSSPPKDVHKCWIACLLYALDKSWILVDTAARRDLEAE